MDQPDWSCYVHGSTMEKHGRSDSTLFEPEGTPIPCWVYSCESCRNEERAEERQYVVLRSI